MHQNAHVLKLFNKILLFFKLDLKKKNKVTSGTRQ